MAAFVNLSAYKFVPLDNLPALRERLLRESVARGLKGTVLLSAEGINLFVAGTRDDAQAFLTVVRSVPGLGDLAPKESASAAAPFGGMRVKLKREIIAFGIDGVDPARRPTPKLAPAELRRWLDEGRPVTLLDTRNVYEVERGTFRGAVRTGIHRFRDFPAAVQRLEPNLRDQPLVMFCTGGIRCEKAGPFMEREGFRHVLQLDGGILKYFEQCGSAHYDGDCFVFDERDTVDAGLRPTATRFATDNESAETAGACPPRPADRSATGGRSADATADRT